MREQQGSFVYLKIKFALDVPLNQYRVVTFFRWTSSATLGRLSFITEIGRGINYRSDAFLEQSMQFGSHQCTKGGFTRYLCSWVVGELAKEAIGVFFDHFLECGGKLQPRGPTYMHLSLYRTQDYILSSMTTQSLE